MEKFYFIKSLSHDPYFNLASEEFLLKNSNNNFIYLWINSPAIIVGKNQNTIAEINLANVEKYKIPVIRRLSGGGAVYHDLNNICFTFIAPYEKEINNFIKFTRPLIMYLNNLGVNAKFSGRNDVTIQNKKISGNAEVIFKNRILHHGTILYKTNLNFLTKVLKNNKIQTETKAIYSIKKRVTNIYPFLKNKISTEKFYNGLCDYMGKDCLEYKFTNSDINKINELVKCKYSLYDWNVGYSPKGEYKFMHKFNFGNFYLNFDLESGLIKNTKIFGDFFQTKFICDLENNINNIHFTKADFSKALSNVQNYILNSNKEEILAALF